MGKSHEKEFREFKLQHRDCQKQRDKLKIENKHLTTKLVAVTKNMKKLASEKVTHGRKLAALETAHSKCHQTVTRLAEVREELESRKQNHGKLKEEYDILAIDNKKLADENKQQADALQIYHISGSKHVTTDKVGAPEQSDEHARELEKHSELLAQQKQQTEEACALLEEAKRQYQQEKEASAVTRLELEVASRQLADAGQVRDGWEEEKVQTAHLREEKGKAEAALDKVMGSLHTTGKELKELKAKHGYGEDGSLPICLHLYSATREGVPLYESVPFRFVLSLCVYLEVACIDTLEEFTYYGLHCLCMHCTCAGVSVCAWIYHCQLVSLWRCL